MKSKTAIPSAALALWMAAFVAVSAMGANLGPPRTPQGQQPTGSAALSGGELSTARPADLPKGASEAWWARVQQNIRKDEYSAVWDEHPGLPGLKAAWSAPNRAQGFEAYFSERGVRVARLGNEGTSWEWGLELVRWGREGAWREAPPGRPRAAANRVDLDRGAIKEWFLNDARGLEQGFTISAPLERVDAPSSPRPAPPTPLGLLIDLALTGTLHPRISEDGQAVDFYSHGGNVSVLRYGALKVTDATGRELPACFKGIPGAIRICIDDTGATYPITVDPLATSPSWTATGEANWDKFGYSVATAGDVNGDGYSDVIVGACGNSTIPGKVHVYLGGPSGLSSTASWTAVGEVAGDYFGWSVSTVGDVNGDGYSDVLVGAIGYDGYRGKAYVYLGGPSGLSSTAAWTAPGEAADDTFGNAVATAGDVNGDGYSDVIVGAYACNAFQGKAYLYLGGPLGLSTTASWTAVGEAENDCFGYSVATAGDVNGDGYSDVIVGALYYDGGQPDEGRAYVYLGSALGLSSTAVWTAESDQASANFGWSVGTAGDVNGDGYSDVLVGAVCYDGYRGKAYLYLGAPSGLSSSASWTAAGEAENDYFSFSVATAGDVNGDGYSDVIIGASGASDSTGKAYLYLGGPLGLSTTASWTAVGEAPNSQFDRSGATAGDVNGDGYSDVIVGASGASDSTGKAYFYLGGPATLSTASTWAPETANEEWGAVVASAGDVNGDGYSDVVVGTPFYGSNNGKAYLYLGGPAGLSATSSWSATGEAADDGFGFWVASAGDVNGDGYADVAVSAIGHNSLTGQAYLYLGGPSGLSSTASWTAAGEAANDEFGYSLATAGDVNGDGYSDLFVGIQWDTSTPGKAYLYLGGPTGLPSTASWTATGEVDSDGFGNSVATAGDVNGDGYSDVVVGAPYNGGSSGKAYLYLGGPAGLPGTASWTATGTTSESFGACVATAGDVNGDGYSDVVIGAPGNSGSAGKTYLYLGGPSGLSGSASWSAAGEAAGNLFGSSVATAGDVNEDGFSDVIVGAPCRSMYTGKVYLYLGGPAGLPGTASWTVAGADVSMWALGYGVAAAGDVNGDGYSDVIVSAPSRYFFEGHALLYYGNGGPGVPVIPRQLRSDLTAPIAPLGRAGDGLFALAAVGRTPFGRGDVKLEWQVAPLGGSFATGLNPIQTGPNWSDSETGGAALTRSLLLADGDGPYIWRMRTKYSPATTPFQGHGPWLTLAANGLKETDLRRVPRCVLPTGACSITSVTKSGASCTLTWTDPNSSSQRTGWNVRRSSDASLAKSSWPIMGLNVQTDPWTDSTGDIPASGVLYYQVTAYNGACAAEGPF